ncbi:MAG: hypothetical protein ACHQ51_11785 [Elusimicrobiota bacterium]
MNSNRMDSSLTPVEPKGIKGLSIVLGIWMFLFGFLKLFHPFSGWFHTQIQNSGLPLISIPFGIATEILVGLMYLIPWLSAGFSLRTRRQINVVASLILISQMIVATYVHLQPNVPASVLPLGIKLPFIPLTVLLLAALNAYLSLKASGGE